MRNVQAVHEQEVQRRMVLVVIFFFIFLNYLFVCFTAAIFHLVHDVEAIHGLCLTTNSIWKSFLKYENCSFTGITHISGKKIQMLLAVKEGDKIDN